MKSDFSPEPPAQPPQILFEAFGGELPEREADAWSRLNPAQRSRALSRLMALMTWKDGSGTINAAEAAEQAGVGLSRFYRLAAEWRAGPSLAALGTFASKRRRGSKFKPDAINALQAAVPRVVRLNGGASVSRLVELLVEAAGVPSDDLPRSTKLREIVQDEIRRLEATHDAGTAVVFDCVASSLPREDGRPHILFACVDRGTRCILGLGIGEIHHSVIGYADAAADALQGVEDGGLALPWGRRLAKAELTAGMDLEACESLVARLNDEVAGTNFQLARKPKRFGRYLRELVGPRLGKVAFTPTRTMEGTALAANGDMTPWTKADALRALREAAAVYNAELLEGEEAVPEGPPATLLIALRAVSKHSAGR
ncbi:MAG TPA: hypothetical protein VF548_01485 [Allosphingosinicella sp.]|jgi:hypothetical protein